MNVMAGMLMCGMVACLPPGEPPANEAGTPRVEATALEATPADATPGVDETSHPRKATIEDLELLITSGNYTAVRKLRIGYELTVEGEVIASRCGNVVRLSKHWLGTLHNLPKDHGYQTGDRIRLRALIVDEAYSGLQLWVYESSRRDETPPPTQPTREEASR